MHLAGKDLALTDLQYADEYALMACESWLHLWHKIGMSSHSSSSPSFHVLTGSVQATLPTCFLARLFSTLPSNALPTDIRSASSCCVSIACWDCPCAPSNSFKVSAQSKFKTTPLRTTLQTGHRHGLFVRRRKTKGLLKRVCHCWSSWARWTTGTILGCRRQQNRSEKPGGKQSGKRFGSIVG